MCGCGCWLGCRCGCGCGWVVRCGCGCGCGCGVVWMWVGVGVGVGGWVGVGLIVDLVPNVSNNSLSSLSPHPTGTWPIHSCFTLYITVHHFEDLVRQA